LRERAVCKLGEAAGSVAFYRVDQEERGSDRRRSGPVERLRAGL